MKKYIITIAAIVLSFSILFCQPRCLFENEGKVKIINNSTNYDSSSGGNSFVINISDKETAEKIASLVEKLVKNLDK